MKFNKLTPNLMVENVKESVEFYTDVLGFKLNMIVPKNTKSVETTIEKGKEYVYAMLSQDEVFFMLMEKKVFKKDLPILSQNEIGASASLYIDVDDINEIHNRVKNKTQILIDLHSTWYGMQEFYIKDIDGYVLCFAQTKQA